ncbi:Leucine-rich repeat protein [Handroanthus impetiginosus]|uniref:Leucine-rich repeat protein n=1 Tax=Handroanthus impetiginosus TaxID=429701 RepID=A0A2G9I750_9LAMI|nr:Leucine-rich repeat protein [Handroanthus impetiginosus]
MALKVNMITSNSLAFLQVFLLLILAIIPWSFEEDVNGVKCQERERLALVKFKSQLIDDYGRLSTWGNYRGEDDDREKVDCCKWKGVFCDDRTNHVVALDLRGPSYYGVSPTSPLRGNISSSLLELADLNYLDLGFNDFNGTQIPEFICALGKLQHLDLEYSGVSGIIPHCLGNLSKLLFLDLSRNGVHDTNLDWLSGFQSLEYLDLSQNNLQGMIIPDALGNLTSLSEIYMVNCSLEGKIPDALGKLRSLSKLELSYNNLEAISDALWNITSLSYLRIYYNIKLRGEFNNVLNLSLPNLQELDLSENMLSGPVPNLSLCPSLIRLRLTGNMFSGSLTESIGYLPQVEIIDLRRNRLEGLISETPLFNLSKLTVLYLSSNSNLTVRIDPSWNPPSQLEGLLLGSCKLGPYFPRWLQKQKRLEILDISNAKISDGVPDWFWDNMQNCVQLNMSYNQMYGVVPDLSSKRTLYYISLSSNMFNGSLPLLPPAVSDVNFSGNKFSGTIFNYCYLRNLHFLDLSDNLLFSQIPQSCFINLMSLNYLDLANNNFSGEIPNLVDLVCRVFSLHLRNNSFTGEILKSLKNCSNLVILDLGGNNFTGIIPDWLGESMPELGVLSLKSNNLHGDLPWSLCHLQKLQVLDISLNNISGSIPECLSNFTVLSSKIDPNSMDYRFFKKASEAGLYDSAYIMWKGKEAEYAKILRFLTIIDLSSNNLIGEIPHEVTSLIGLIALNLSGNNLVGSIPRDIDRLEILNFLDLSKNNISGSIPSALAQLGHLGVLDLSFNNLSGKIPWIAHLQTFNASIYMGNPELCGPPLVLKPCPGDKASAGDVDEANNQEHDNIFNSRGFYISIVLGFIVAFWGVSGTLFRNKWCWITIGKMFNIVED